MTKEKLFKVIFLTDSKAGKVFDIALLTTILFSVLIVLLESVESIHNVYHDIFLWIEYTITLIFTIEYILRIWVSRKKTAYIFSFFGIIDFLSILPAYFALLFSGNPALLIIRAFRLLRVFRILKLTRYTSAGRKILVALSLSKQKIGVFLIAIFTIILFIGTLMYMIEGEDSGFTSIPRGIYWAIVTLTTVGYGDIAPQTALGQFIAGIVMIMGYAIIAVPTGIVTSELTRQIHDKKTIFCEDCKTTIYSEKAKFCHNCGKKLK